MKPIENNIKVTISDIEIDDKYFSFNYQVTVNGADYGQETYESDHCWSDDKKGWREMLEEGEALKLAVEAHFAQN